ncbi:MAG: hypothetical protein KBT85_09125 [Pseudomonas sp.]|uniref:hypothetical protein n=1 Tax=Halopseudomonas laoshanensis TaxID=2268758 RepID=UPI001B3D5B61|nr:hypothetical protein [Pseudomonas sp.]MBQ0776720.1 hypothetical protein [Pseudomonas sp.]
MRMIGPAEQPKRAIPGWIKVVFLVLLIAGMALVVWQQLPRSGISTDLSVIGGERPVLVLTRDVNLLNGAEVLELMRQVEPQYQDAILFRIAHQGQPAGQAFARQHGTQDGDLTLLDQNGEVIGRMVQPRNTEELAQLLPETPPR